MTKDHTGQHRQPGDQRRADHGDGAEALSERFARRVPQLVCKLPRHLCCGDCGAGEAVMSGGSRFGGCAAGYAIVHLGSVDGVADTS